MTIPEYLQSNFSKDIYGICSGFALADDDVVGEIGALVVDTLHNRISLQLLTAEIAKNTGLSEETSGNIVKKVKEIILPKIDMAVVGESDDSVSIDSNEKTELVNKNVLLNEIENPTPTPMRKSEKSLPQSSVIAPAVLTELTSQSAAASGVTKDDSGMLPKLKIMPHTTQELVTEQSKEIAIQKQVSTSFIEKKLTQPQKAGTTAIQKVNAQPTPAAVTTQQSTNPQKSAPVGVPRYTGGTDPYREPPQ